MDMRKMLKQAQEMQSRLQQEVERLEVEATAGGGMVTARMNGKKQLLSIAFKPGAVDPADLEMLQDLVVAAVNEAGAWPGCWACPEASNPSPTRGLLSPPVYLY
jgi:DNA-binding YbaB/EbfC family protein